MGSRVLVVGGGISGLSAALTLAQLGASVELWEAAPRLGGAIRTSPFAGVAGVDEGADAYLTRVPHAVELARSVGIDAASSTSPATGDALVWCDRLHDLPSGTLLGVPANLGRFVTSGLLSWRGKLRAAIEPAIPRRPHDDSIGRLVRTRLGDEVHDRLVDALLGSIYATDTDRASFALAPQLEALTTSHRSLLVAARSARPPTANESAVFAAPLAGMQALVEATAAAITALGGSIHTARAVERIEAGRGGFEVGAEHFDGVVIATPGRSAAALLCEVAPNASDSLRCFESADVVIVRLAIDASRWPARLAGRSGYLVPKSRQRRVTATSFASQKWAHWRPADGSQILRVSLGRDGLPVDDLDDLDVLRCTVDEVGEHLGFDIQPTAFDIVRWQAAFPQYRPGHRDRVAAIDADLPPGMALAGASYRGIGIPACIADGQRAARRVMS